MVIDGQPGGAKKNKKEIGLEFQVGAEGISYDYLNNTLMGVMYSKALLGVPGFKVSDYATSEIELKKQILKTIKNFPSYTEYMMEHGVTKGKGKAFQLNDFLTPKGNEIVARLDEITLEIKSLYVEDPKTLKVENALKLFQEVDELIKAQDR